MRTAFAMSDVLLIALGGGVLAACAVPLRWLTRGVDGAHAPTESLHSVDESGSFAAPAVQAAGAS